MYKDILLDHYRKPHNSGRLRKKSHSALLFNPLCGDRIQMDLLLEDGVIKEVSFAGDGCVISTASASLLTDYIKEKKLSDLINIDSKFMMDLIGIEVSPGRIKCLMLPQEALKKALGSK